MGNNPFTNGITHFEDLLTASYNLEIPSPGLGGPSQRKSLHSSRSHEVRISIHKTCAKAKFRPQFVHLQRQRPPSSIRSVVQDSKTGSTFSWPSSASFQSKKQNFTFFRGFSQDFSGVQWSNPRNSIHFHRHLPHQGPVAGDAPVPAAAIAATGSRTTLISPTLPNCFKMSQDVSTIQFLGSWWVVLDESHIFSGVRTWPNAVPEAARWAETLLHCWAWN